MKKRGGGRIVNVTTVAVPLRLAGETVYAASKAALEQLTAVLAAEHPDLRVYAVDPGDMRTQMQQDAFPGEDISDRPPPEDSVPALLALLTGDLASGREVRLRNAYFITCRDVVKDASGRVVELRCTYDPDTRSGSVAAAWSRASARASSDLAGTRPPPRRSQARTSGRTVGSKARCVRSDHARTAARSH